VVPPSRFAAGRQGMRGRGPCRLAVMPSPVRTLMIQRRRGHHSVLQRRLQPEPITRTGRGRCPHTSRTVGTATTRLMSVVWATVIHRVVARSPVPPTSVIDGFRSLPDNGVVAPNDDLDGAGSCGCGPGLESPRPRHGPGPSYTSRAAGGCAKPPSPEDRHQRGSKRITPTKNRNRQLPQALGGVPPPKRRQPPGDDPQP
jgi:hypothetical protein